MLLFFTACSNTKYLAEGQSLYVGSDVEIEDSVLSKKERKSMESELESALRPKPNKTFLGLRIKLWIHNVVGEPKSNKGLKYWMQDKFGEPPVLGSDFNVEYNNEIIENYLGNEGFLHASSIGNEEIKKKKKKAYFKVKTDKQSIINDVEFTVYDTLQLSKHIKNTRENTLLKEGDAYNLNTIKKERERISETLKTFGYYYFSPNHILVRADTSVGTYKMDLKVDLKLGEMPKEAMYQYKMNEILVFPNYQLQGNRGRRPSRYADTLSHDSGFKIIDPSHSFKSAVFHQAMQFKPGEYYDKRKQNISLNRLISLGTFKFVKNEFSIVEDTDEHLLDVHYLLTPAPKKAFNIELGGFGNDENRLGSRASITWRNRNLLKGAELFTVKVSGGLEKQYGGELKRPDQYNVGVELGLNIPRFLVPFIPIKASGMFIPRTLIHVNYDMNLRKDYSITNVYTANFGYNWKEDAAKEHKLFPINVSLVHTDTFNKNPDFEVNLSNLFYNGIIIGPTYEYTYNSQLKRTKKHNFYFNGRADLSGNIIGLTQRANFENNPKKLLGMDFAQYVKLQADFRYYLHFTKESVLAARAFGGWGISYGNSSQLPNIKQFYTGGSNSLRGFQSRLVGPGSYHEVSQTGGQTFIEMLGDIRLEANLEWRMQLYKFLKGALFVDAGNIWLQRPNSKFPGGEISKDFYKEIAVNAGLGARLDFSILILRLDFGFPIRQPWLPEGDRWTYKYIDFRDSQWRRSNLIFNIAIGYPF